MDQQSSPQILLVEDDRDIIETFKELLEGEGYSVECAYSGKQALEFLQKGRLPKLIMLDLMMPIMDGFAFRREQRKDPKIANIPVVIMSADGNIEAKLAQIEAEGYLRKPADIESILSTVQAFVG